MRTIFSLIFLSLTLFANAQISLHPGTYEQSLSTIENEGQTPENNTLNIMKVVVNNNTIAIYNIMRSLKDGSEIRDTSVADATTLSPISHSADHGYCAYELHYSKDAVTGYYYDNLQNTKTDINDPIAEPVIDQTFFDYMITTFPYKEGYTKQFAVYNYFPDGQSNVTKGSIKSVTSGVYASKISGNHNVWQIAVGYGSDPMKTMYYIDKETRRIWKIDKTDGSGMHLLTMDTEKDNPNAKPDNETNSGMLADNFDREATLKLTQDGKSVISGQAFARDHVHGADKIAITNVNKKQYASPGTIVSLIPYTDYFKKWVQLSDASIKKTGNPLPLPQEARDCIKTAKVGAKGHFEFTNLMPGDYLLITEINYVHSWTSTEVVGQTDTYINGAYAGSTDNTVQHNGAAMMGDEARTLVTIKNDGDKVDAKLKSWK